MFKLYNTLTRKKEEFKPLKPPKVGLYACGPTVYAYAHLGHFRAYVFVDVLCRALEYSGYQVKHVMNVTDVGHLVGDQDLGEDKMEVGAKREKRTVEEIAKFYTDDFFAAMEKLNVLRPQVVCKATEHIQEMINLVKKIEKNGFTYRISDGLYFDTSKLADYGKLAGLDVEGLREGARVEANPEKKNPTDFALWRFSPNPPVGGQKRQMEWQSPWGVGFPGWHIECTAMGVKYLGEEFGIHTGGVDHIPIHHTNEIAQAQGALGHDVVRFWLHNEFLLVEGKKMSKSLRNIFNIHDVEKRGFDPLSLRYLFLTTHYRKRMNFTWKSLEGAQRALKKLRDSSSGVDRVKRDKGDTSGVESWQNKFGKAISDDLNTPQALAILWDLLKAKVADKDKRELLLDFDRVLGLKLGERRAVEKIPDEVQELIKEREKFRKQKKWQDADKMRQKIEKLGWRIEDTAEGPKLGKSS